MPINNFKLFDENKANMMTDQEYNIAQQRLNGVQSGVASSQLQNKTLYQTALMCYALAQLMAANGYDANDADAVSTFVNNMSSSMVQKVVDKASSADLDAKTVGKWVDAAQLGVLKESVSNDYLKLAGGTMLGNLILNADPTQNLQAATKQYVDGKAFKIEKLEVVGTKNVTKSGTSTRTVSFNNINPYLIIADMYDGSDRLVMMSKTASYFDRGNTAYYQIDITGKTVKFTGYSPNYDSPVLDWTGHTYTIIGIEF